MKQLTLEKIKALASYISLSFPADNTCLEIIRPAITKTWLIMVILIAAWKLSKQPGTINKPFQ